MFFNGRVVVIKDNVQLCRINIMCHVLQLVQTITTPSVAYKTIRYVKPVQHTAREFIARSVAKVVAVNSVNVAGVSCLIEYRFVQLYNVYRYVIK